MDWILPLTSSPAFNFSFSFTALVWISIIGVVIGAKVLKEAFRR
ncbi:MAG: hypothetical protein AB7U24_02900 [Sulfurimonadaceae bacterium]|jgi:hypothetical protein